MHRPVLRLDSQSQDSQSLRLLLLVLVLDLDLPAEYFWIWQPPEPSVDPRLKADTSASAPSLTL